MKKYLISFLILIISLISLAGCNTSSDFGLTLEVPSGWSQVSGDTYLKIINDSEEDQYVIINKFKSISYEKDIWLWLEESNFPTPSSEHEELTVNQLQALKIAQRNTVIVPIAEEGYYYMIQDCLSLTCDVLDEDLFFEILDSIEITY
jgi:hypothetical protein